MNDDETQQPEPDEDAGSGTVIEPDDDTEGHRRHFHVRAADGDDDTRRIMSKPADDDDAEGHRIHGV